MAHSGSHAGAVTAPAALSPALARSQRLVGRLAGAAFAIARCLVLIDLLLLGVSVTARYFLGTPVTWGDEIVALSLAAITLLSASKVLLDGGHIEVDILTGMARGKLRLVIRLWSSLAVLGVALLLIFNGWSTAMFSKMIGLLTEGHLELPLWVLQLLLPLGGALMLPVVLLQDWETIALWRRGALVAPEPMPIAD